MKRRISILLLLISICLTGFTQVFSVSGCVRDHLTNAPIAGANIYLLHTTLATSSDSRGNFRMDEIPSGKYQLMLTHVGYRSIKLDITPFFSVDTFYMQPDALVLSEVVVAARKNGKPQSWSKWGNLFKDVVMGNSAFSNACKIENKEVVRFFHDRKADIVTARTTAPLIIQNPELGYTLHYEIDQFRVNRKDATVLSTAMIRFSEMEGGEGSRQKWRRNREAIYKMSLLRFIRALYNNELTTKGYVANRLNSLKIADSIVLGVNEFWVDRKMGHVGNVLRAGIDTVAIVSSKEIVASINGETAILNFDGILSVQLTDSLYDKQLTADYLHASLFLFSTNSKHSYGELIKRMSSVVQLRGNKPIYINQNGSFTNGADILTGGFWAWTEKVPTMLPLNYGL